VKTRAYHFIKRQQSLFVYFYTLFNFRFINMKQYSADVANNKSVTNRTHAQLHHALGLWRIRVSDLPGCSQQNFGLFYVTVRFKSLQYGKLLFISLLAPFN